MNGYRPTWAEIEVDVGLGLPDLRQSNDLKAAFDRILALSVM
jgi:hypothetical protein